MITKVESEKLVIFSDLHLGNPFSNVRSDTVEFIDWVSRNGFDLCINGDGFEVSQVSMSQMAHDVPDVLHALHRAVEMGTRVFYVVGNHDILFEHFLSDLGGVKLVPFLNLQSAGKRFRIEHGHLYDRFFVRFPRLYEFCTWLGGFALALHPSLYFLWIKFEKAKSYFRKNSMESDTIPGEPPEFVLAAKEILKRGFDGVIYGHTHHLGRIDFPDGGIYCNSGSWMLKRSYIKIEYGKMTIEEFGKSAA